MDDRKPTPEDKRDRERWEHTAQRVRILTGDWEKDAEGRLKEFFDQSVHQFLPRPEMSRNPARAIFQQTAVLYDTPPVVTAGNRKLDALHLKQLWPMMQETCLFVQGLNECLVRVDWSETAGITYRVVTPDYVVAYATHDQPTVPYRIEELAPRKVDGREVWVWETWDVSIPDQPVFRLEQVKGDVRIDVTEKLVGSTAYPYLDHDGRAVLPYELYHSRVGSELWSYKHGSELFSGTLTTSALWTWWLGGTRDGAHPQRVLLNGRVRAKRVTESATGTEYVAMNPLAILEVTDQGDKSAAIDQWEPAMKPKEVGESIESFEAGLAIYAGLSPADIQRGTAAVSGYSIVVSRDGQRRAQKRIIPPMEMSDRRLMARAAAIVNRAEGLALPTDPDAYHVGYAEIPKTIEEVKAEVEELTTLLEAGLLTPVQAYQRVHRGTTDEDAMKRMKDARLQRLQLEAVTLEDDNAGRDPDAEPDEPAATDEPAAA